MGLHFFQKYISLCFVIILLNSCQGDQLEVDRLPDRVSYNFHVRPILTDRCFSCHGPDEAARKANLRLDLGESVFETRTGDGSKILVAGKASKSILWQRINSSDDELTMPPVDSKLSLSPYEKLLIKKWINQGAHFEPHWAFQPVAKPKIPKSAKNGEMQPIDAYISEKLDENYLTFSEEADRFTMLRRLFFDLTGIGPTPLEMETYLADRRPDFYSRLVDSLLNTTAFAERMTTDWLDLARYADSQGMHSDGWRSMYPWRDWVINAFRQNMPYDQFILEQLAGDLLPNPNIDQLIATGFNRNHQTTAEGGVVDEEFRKEYAHDRVATTATTFLGLTMECAKCHDHKYDPISQSDYYQFFGFFDQADEVGMTGDDGNSGPNLLLPDKAVSQQIDSLQNLISQQLKAINERQQEVLSRVDFLRDLSGNTIISKRQIHLPFDLLQGSVFDRSLIAKGSSGVELVSSKRGKVVAFDDEYDYINISKVGLFEQHQSFSASVWVKPDVQKTSQTIMGNSGQKGVFWRGWDFILDSLNRPTLRLIHALPQDMLVVRAANEIDVDQWTHLAFVYDGSGQASGVKFYINGRITASENVRDQLQRSIYPMAFNKERTETPLRIGKSYRAFTGEYGIYEGLMDDLMVFNRRLSGLEIASLAGIKSLDEVRRAYLTGGKDDLRDALEEHYLALHPDAEYELVGQRRRQIIDLLEKVPEVMVMQDRAQPAPTHVLIRGNYDQPAEVVSPGTPEAIFGFSDTLPKNRLGLAKWLIAPDNPLTARVAVNRLWQQFFGKGLVTTPHDFGLQGHLPSHPELLDYLAFELLQNGWDLRQVIRMIVNSRTYKQSSRVTKEKRNLDPDNRYLSRGPSNRLTAEMIRDQALAAAFLLDSAVGGPSVKPWQPEGLWEEKTSSTHLLQSYIPDTGAGRYRRSMYTFVRRTSMHPMMEIFDAPTRSVCIAKRQITDSPVQALVLLNDPQFIEAARCLAEKMVTEYHDPAERISVAYQRLCSKEISEEKLLELTGFYEEEERRFSEKGADAQLYTSIGQYEPAFDDRIAELAALTLTVNTIMNLDDFYYKR